MTTCVTGVCGTGDWSGPLPGDPDNSSILSATPAFGGIDVSWTFPALNPHAVSHTRLYRAILPDYAAATLHSIVAGNFFYDKVNNSIRYYYWIQIISVNGTVADLIGPATAVARPTIEQVLEQLTGKIDAGVLAQSLKTEIDRITLLNLGLAQEIQDRLQNSQALSDALAGVQTEVGQTATLVQQEISARTEGQAALVTALDVVAAGASGNAAAIVNEKNLRVSADEALATQITQLYTTVGNDITAAVLSEATARANEDAALATQITSLEATAASNLAAAIQTEQSARASDIEAVGQQITTVQATAESKGKIIAQDAEPAIAERLPQNLWIDTTGGANTPKRWNGAAWVASTDKVASDAAAAALLNAGAIQTETQARINEDSALAQQITTAQTTWDGNLASVQTTLQTNIDTVDGEVSNIGALYTAKVGVNGLIGGFGIYNDGTEVQAGFDVDTFWVGRTGPDKKKPFMVDAGTGEVFMNDAVVQKLTFNKLRADDGSVVVEDGKLKAAYIGVSELSALTANIGLLRTATSGQRTEYDSNGVRVYDSNGTLRVRLGIW